MTKTLCPICGLHATGTAAPNSVAAVLAHATGMTPAQLLADPAGAALPILAAVAAGRLPPPRRV